MVIKAEEDKLKHNIVWGVIKKIKSIENWYLIANFEVKDKRKLMPWAYNRKWTFWTIKWELTPEQLLLIHEWCEFDAVWEFVNNNFDFRTIPAYRANLIPTKIFIIKSITFSKEQDVKAWYLKQFLIYEVNSIWEKLANRMFENMTWEELENLLNQSEEEVIKYFKKNKVKWLSERIIKILYKAWNDKLEQRVIIEKLWKFGLTSLEINKVYNEYWDKSDQIINTNPYQLVELKWFGFKKADEIALRMWFDRSSDFRLSAYIESIIDELSQNDTIFWKEEVIWIVKQKLVNETQFIADFWIWINELVHKWFDFLVEKKKLVQLNENIYILTKYLNIETEVFENLEKRYSIEFEKWIKLKEYMYNENTKDEWSLYEKEYKTKFLNRLKELCWDILMSKEFTRLTPLQKKWTIQPLLDHLTIIWWFAWSWKTTTTKILVDFIKRLWKSCILIAPTNKACKRIREVHWLRWLRSEPIQVKTVHSLLWLRKNSESVHTDSDDYKENWMLKYDYIIVDETSMVWIVNIWKLLKVTELDTHLVFVWDPFQLASIDTWSFLNDLIESKRYFTNTIIFNSVFRVDWEWKVWFNQVKEWVHNIIWNSELIRAWKKPINADMTMVKWYITIWEEQVKEIKWYIKAFFDKIKADWDPTYLSWQILCPNYNGDLWIHAINTFCSNILNWNNEIVKIWNKSFRVKDKVFYNARNDKLWLVKWDTWIITKIDKDHWLVYLQLWLVDELWDPISITLDFDDVKSNLELWYAMSIHKSQWSEFDRCMVIITNQSYMTVNQNLLYTWYTRWKKVVYLIYEDSALAVALKKRENAKNTYLFHLLCNHDAEDIELQREVWNKWMTKEEEKFIFNALIKSKYLWLEERLFHSNSYKYYSKYDLLNQFIKKQLSIYMNQVTSKTDSVSLDLYNQKNIKDNNLDWLYNEQINELNKEFDKVVNYEATNTNNIHDYQMYKFKPILKNYFWIRYVILDRKELKEKNISLEDNFLLDENNLNTIKSLNQYIFIWIKKFDKEKEISKFLIKKVAPDISVIHFDLDNKEIIYQYYDKKYNDERDQRKVLEEYIDEWPPPMTV